MRKHSRIIKITTTIGLKLGLPNLITADPEEAGIVELGFSIDIEAGWVVPFAPISGFMASGIISISGILSSCSFFFCIIFSFMYIRIDNLKKDE